jgi:hypothetical protein
VLTSASAIVRHFDAQVLAGLPNKRRKTMSILDSPTAALTILTEDPFFDEGQVAAAAFLARYSGRTLDAYRYDL